MNAIDRLIAVAEYPTWARRAGHTTIMIYGVRACVDQRPVVVVAPDNVRAMSDEINDPRVAVMTVDAVDRLRGMQRPLFVDHEALRVLVDDAVKEMQNIILTARAEEKERTVAQMNALKP